MGVMRLVTGERRSCRNQGFLLTPISRLPTIRILTFLLCALLILLPFHSYASSIMPELVVQTGHTGLTVNAVAFSPDGRLLATGGDDDLIIIWDSASGHELRALVGHSGYVNSLSFSPDGRLLASGSSDSLIKLWDMTGGAEIQTLAGHKGIVNEVAFSPNGSILASAGEDGTIRLWDVKGGKETATFSGESGGVSSLALSPDGRLLAGGINDSLVRIWDISTQKAVFDLPGHSDSVISLAFNPDGKTLASGSMDKNVKIWSVASGKELRTIEDSRERVYDLAFSPDGRTLAGGSLGTMLWDASTGKLLSELRPPGEVESVYAIAFSPDGKTLATGSNGSETILWDVAAAKATGKLSGHSPPISACAFIPGSNILAAQCNDKSVRLCDLDRGNRFRTISDLELCARLNFFFQGGISPDEKVVASVTDEHEDYRVAKLQDMRTGKVLRAFTGHRDTISALQISPDSRQLATGSKDNDAKLWDLATGNELFTLRGHTGNVAAVAFSPDGKTLATGSYDRTIKLWDVSGGGELRTLQGCEDSIWCVAWSPDGRLIAGSGFGKKILVWDAATGHVLNTLSGHTNVVTGLVFAPGGKILISGALDGRIMFWQVEGAKELGSLISLDDEDWVFVSPEGFFDGSARGWASIEWRTGNLLFPIEAYFSEFYQPGILKDIFRESRPIREILEERKDSRAGMNIAAKDRRLPRLSIKATPVSAERNTSIEIKVDEEPADRDHPGSAPGIYDLRLFRNGTLIKYWKGARKSGETVTCEARVLRGDNEFRAYAFNRDGVKSRDASCMVKGSCNIDPRAFILSIGINKYSIPDYNLDFAVKDATELAGKLQESLPVAGKNIHLTLLLDEKATREAILNALRDLAGRAGPEDRVIITYAGHGINHENAFYLIPHDIGQGEALPVAELAAKGISDGMIADLLAGDGQRQGIDAGNIALIIDSCHSGKVLESEEWRVGPMNSRGLAQLAWEKGMEILTASQSNQYAKELRELGHGILTKCLLDGFSKAPRSDNGLYADQWLDYAVDEVPKIAGSEKMRGLIPPMESPIVVITARSLQELKGASVDVNKIEHLRDRELIEDELEGELERLGFSGSDINMIVKICRDTRSVVNIQTPCVFHGRDWQRSWLISK